MLSGLTSQFSGLMGRKAPAEGEQAAGESNDANAAAAAAGTGAAPETTTSPTATATGAVGDAAATASSAASNVLNAGGSVISSVTNSIKLPSWSGGSSWFGGKKEEGTAVAQEATESSPAPNQEASLGRVTPGEGSDGSSATGGADSEKEVRKTNKVPPEIPEEDPAAEGAAQAGLGKVKTFGMSIFTSIKGAGQKIKDTNILSEFQKEHESFLRGRGSKSEAVAPWVGHPKEEALKEEILSLSTDRRNFVRSPPAGVSFEWDWEVMAPIAKAILKEDPNLEKMRYDLVPKVVSEENFWRNYFYRVMLLKESMSEDESGKKKRDSIDTDDEDEVEKELNEELKSFEVVDSSSATAKKSDVDEKELDSLLDLK